MIDLTNQKFGRLTAAWPVGVQSPKNRSVMWLCFCECGNFKVVRGAFLRNGASQSCGCLQSDVVKKHGHTYSKGIKKSSPTYKSWESMKRRCTNPHSTFYRYYGGRGIKVCTRWRHSFANFLADMGERPEGTTLDRINVNGNYTPSNCRWATPSQQIHNRRPSLKKAA